MELWDRLIDEFPYDDAFKIFLVSEWLLPATKVSEQVSNLDIPGLKYTTFPKARVMVEGEPARVPPGAIHIVYREAQRQDNYTPQNADAYFGIPCPRGGYPRPLKCKYTVEDYEGYLEFFEMSCPLESPEPAKMLARFSFAASKIKAKVTMECEYDEASIRPFVTAETQEEAQRVIRGMGVSTVYPDYVAALRRLALLSGPLASDICINTEDPVTLEDLNDVDQDDIIHFGRSVNGKQSCATLDSLKDYIKNPIRLNEPVTNPSDRSDIISQDTIDEIIAKAIQRDPSYVVPFKPLIVTTEGEDSDGNDQLEIFVLYQDDQYQSQTKLLGVIPLTLPALQDFAREVGEIITNPDNFSRVFQIIEEEEPEYNEDDEPIDGTEHIQTYILFRAPINLRENFWAYMNSSEQEYVAMDMMARLRESLQ